MLNVFAGAAEGRAGIARIGSRTGADGDESRVPEFWERRGRIVVVGS